MPRPGKVQFLSPMEAAALGFGGDAPAPAQPVAGAGAKSRAPHAVGSHTPDPYQAQVEQQQRAPKRRRGSYLSFPGVEAAGTKGLTSNSAARR
jgi:hypothetical protein